MRKMFLMSVLAFVSNPSFAAIIEINAVPSSWKLESYTGNNVVAAWYAGSSCTNGILQFSSNATNEDKNRFWAVVMSAKVSSKKVFVSYDNSTSSCFISSFGMPVE